ncbi:hypothetical protein [Lactococcus petauri]|uniref:hypothetical protein n=1 Tax=Lactococcus petauri TaxID=1940789 RepID=UPI001F56765E|nr:hypothetical protein [Lactococcus petauri]
MGNKNSTVLSDKELQIFNGGHWALSLGKNSNPYAGTFLSNHKFKPNRNTLYGIGGSPNLHNW